MRDFSVIRYPSSKSQIESKTLFYFALFVFFIVEVIPDFQSNTILWYSSIGFLTFAFVFDRQKICINQFLLWQFTFLICCFVSLAWARNINVSLEVIKAFVMVIFLLLLIYPELNSGETIRRVLFLRLLAYIILLVYVYIFSRGSIGVSRLGDDMGNAWKSNAIASDFSIAVLICFYFFSSTEKKLYKIVYILLMLAFIYLLLYSGSRASLFMMLIGISVYMIARQRRLSFLILIPSIVAIVYYLIMSVPSLYNVIGYRIDDLFLAFQGQTGEEGSAISRMNMYRYGFLIFRDSPLFGYGVGNYRVLYAGAFGRLRPSHSVFIEILTGLGLSGIVAYFSLHCSVLIRYVKNIKLMQTNEASYAISSLVCLLFLCAATNSYCGFSEMLTLMLSWLIIVDIPKKQPRKDS